MRFADGDAIISSTYAAVKSHALKLVGEKIPPPA